MSQGVTKKSPIFISAQFSTSDVIKVRAFPRVTADGPRLTSTFKQGPSLWLTQGMARLIEPPSYRPQFISRRINPVFVTHFQSWYHLACLSIKLVTCPSPIQHCISARWFKNRHRNFSLEKHLRWKFHKTEGMQVGKDILPLNYHIMTNSDNKFI